MEVDGDGYQASSQPIIEGLAMVKEVTSSNGSMEIEIEENVESEKKRTAEQKLVIASRFIVVGVIVVSALVVSFVVRAFLKKDETADFEAQVGCCAQHVPPTQQWEQQVAGSHLLFDAVSFCSSTPLQMSYTRFLPLM